MSVVTPLIIERMGKARVTLAGRAAFYTIREAADALGVCEATLYGWRKRGLLNWRGAPANPHRPPSRVIDPADLRRLIGMTP